MYSCEIHLQDEGQAFSGIVLKTLPAPVGVLKLLINLWLIWNWTRLSFHGMNYWSSAEHGEAEAYSMTPACVTEGARSSQIYYGCILWSSVLNIQNSVTHHSHRSTWDEHRWHNTPDMQSHTSFRCVEWDERFNKRWDDQDGWRQHYLVIWLNHCTITKIKVGVCF